MFSSSSSVFLSSAFSSSFMSSIYDLPTYVLHVIGHFWMFAVKITEWLFSLKGLGLWTHLWTHLPIVWDKVPNKFGFFLTPSLSKKQIWRPNNLGYMQFCLCPYWSDVLIWVFSSSFNTTSRSTSSNSQKSRTSTYSLSKNGSCGKFPSSKAVSVRPFVKKLFEFAAGFFAVGRFAELWPISLTP